MANPSDVEARLTALEDLGVKVDANRSAINSLGVQTAGRFDRLEQRVDRRDSSCCRHTEVTVASAKCAAAMNRAATPANSSAAA